MSVCKFDNVLRYYVGSRSRPGLEHLVELDMYGGNGACSCEHFHFNLEPFLKKGATACDALRCHHIKEARQAFTDDVIRQAAKSNGGTSPFKRKPERDNGR
jgi:hypothetical protein